MAKQKKMVGRIRYAENWHGEGEHFVFEWKWDDEDENQWTLTCAAPVVNDMVHYTALTQIREWQKIGIKDIQWK